MENFSTASATTSTFMPNLNTDELVNFPSTATARYIDNPAEYRPSNESQQLPNTHTWKWNHAGQSSYVDPPTYPLWQAQTGLEFRLPNSNPMASRGVQGSCPSQEREIDLHAQMTKIARSNRKMARQRSLSLSKNSSDVPAATTRCTTRRPALSGAFNDVQNTSPTTDEDLYTFCTPDNKKLRVLLKKVLRNSDVGSLGRIVLPKIEAEKNLPILSVKEGIPVIIRDVYSNREWRLRYKFWLNNKSRMYVLENTGDFVRQNGLQIGDSITLYEDESKNLYFSIQKVEKPAAEPSYNQNYSNHNYNHLYASFGNQARDEDAASLAILIEQLKHKEQHEANSLVTFSMDGAASFRQWEVEAQYGSSDNVTSEENSSQQTVAAAEMRNFDDCYSGLGTLPDVSHYNYPYFDFMSSGSHDVHGDE